MTERHKTERLGVNAAEQAFLKLDWLFREQPISDFGIDAHAEPIDSNGPTGTALCIKRTKRGQSLTSNIRSGIDHLAAIMRAFVVQANYL